jgi:hypothetical protein
MCTYEHNYYKKIDLRLNMGNIILMFDDEDRTHRQENKTNAETPMTLQCSLLRLVLQKLHYSTAKMH